MSCESLGELNLSLGAFFKVKGRFIPFKWCKLIDYQFRRFGMLNQALFMECRFVN